MDSYDRRIERKRLVEIAQKYQNDGFEVLLEPRGADLPDFLLHTEPDMIVSDGKQSIVVTIVASLINEISRY